MVTEWRSHCCGVHPPLWGPAQYPAQNGRLFIFDEWTSKWKNEAVIVTRKMEECIKIFLKTLQHVTFEVFPCEWDIAVVVKSPFSLPKWNNESQNSGALIVVCILCLGPWREESGKPIFFEHTEKGAPVKSEGRGVTKAAWFLEEVKGWAQSQNGKGC